MVGHRFTATGEWGGVPDCEVLALEPNRTLSRSWNLAHADPAYVLRSVVTCTLTPTAGATRLRMAQAGFRHPRETAAPGPIPPSPPAGAPP